MERTTSRVRMRSRYVGISRDRAGLRRTSVGIIQDLTGSLGIRLRVGRALPRQYDKYSLEAGYAHLTRTVMPSDWM